MGFILENIGWTSSFCDPVHHKKTEKCYKPQSDDSNSKNHAHLSFFVSYRSEVKARQDVKPDIRQPPFTDYRQPPVDYRHPPVADYRQPPTLDYRHPPLLDYRQLATDARQFALPDYRMPPVQVRTFLWQSYSFIYSSLRSLKLFNTFFSLEWLVLKSLVQSQAALSSEIRHRQQAVVSDFCQEQNYRRASWYEAKAVHTFRPWCRAGGNREEW